MATHYAICLLGAMDRLWFHQIILFPEPISLLFPKTLKAPQPFSESLTSSSSNISQPSIPEEEISSVPSAITPPQDDSDNEVDKKETELKERSTRLNLITSKSRSYSSSPPTEKISKTLRHTGSVSSLQKTMRCKSLSELELEEVKGFMDLGFIFNKEHLSPRMMSVVPGLLRIGKQKTERKTKLMIRDASEVEVAKDEEIEEDEDGDDEDKRGVTRPYLSEAWLIRKPDSPLLNLRIPRVSAAADMKKHLRNWARTVASVIQQES
ncbi:hypothetical protein F0562_016961 [Nyssa sinensis]|uniref:Uncharacterized protein n=1 Tax=Nyssa sinensis TaxID=561372 RepID=A0A5J4ZD29_9ASTE|nr:hypothetical protein F0562_016961 [Nyssa sinensis]